MRFLTSIVGPHGGSPDHGDVVEAVRHMLAAGDWPDAARLLADHLFSLTLDGQEGTIAALLRSFPAGAISRSS